MAWQHENHTSFNVPMKVHINPNFRGKPISSGLPSNRERPVGIHFNPHWKPKTEGTSIPKDVQDTFSDIQNSSQRRTIHINPKVIPNGVPHSISTLLHQEHFPTDVVCTPITAYKEETNPTEAVSQWLNSEIISISSSNHRNISAGTTSSKNTQVHVLPLFNKFKKNIVSANSPTIRTAKIVRSKYKYLNNTLQPHSLHSQLSSSWNVMPSNSASCSRYKFVKGVENIPVSNNAVVPPKRQVVSQFKLVKGIVTSGNVGKVNNVSHVLTPRRLKALKVVENVKSIPQLTVKSRYKLEKNLVASQQNYTFKKKALLSTPKSKSNSRFKFVRQTTPVQKFALKRKSPRVVKSRFQIIRGAGTQAVKCTRYRLLRHVNGTTSHKQRPHQPTSPFGRRNKWTNSRHDLQATKVVITNKKLLRIGRRPESRPSRGDKIRKAKLLNIGGVFYRSTRTTLTRSSTAAPSLSMGKARSYAARDQVLSIRGSRFVLDKSGKTLRRLTSDKLPVFRIHIGGVTFVPSSENTLVRSRVHEARNLVSQAKQRSIAVLTTKLRKNNQPCLIYQRFGKCRLHDKGSCPKVHDPKKIAICNDFVNGKCLKSATECLLSHDVGPEKMPTCHFFLEGCCVRDPCPYSHIKLNRKVAVCRDFLTGYCSAGEKCKKRHVFLCPEFEEHKRCSKGKYCNYRHAALLPRATHDHADESSPKEPQVPTTCKETVDLLTRYYRKNDGASTKDGGKRKLKPDGSSPGASPGASVGSSVGSSPKCVEEIVVLLPERSKLGDLPGFIPL